MVMREMSFWRLPPNSIGILSSGRPQKAVTDLPSNPIQCNPVPERVAGVLPYWVKRPVIQTDVMREDVLSPVDPGDGDPVL